MILGFANAATEDIFEGRDTKAGRRILPPHLKGAAGRKLDQLDSAEALEDLKIPPGNRLESLKGNRAGQHSMRINQQYRVCFRWTEQGPTDVEVVDYHD